MIKKVLLKSYIFLGESISEFILNNIFNDWFCIRFGSIKIVNKLFVYINQFSLHISTLKYNFNYE
jgi:hypothetical protein